MKKIVICLISINILLSQNVSAHTLTTEYSWCFKAVGNHQQPIVFDNRKFPAQYGTIAMGSPDEKVIYLTFDAGYADKNVAIILNILKEQEVKAAFFILPAVIELNTDIAIRMAQEGHVVANHSYSHKNMVKITDKEEFLKEITLLEELYLAYTGYAMSKFFRPPEGKFSEQNLQYCQDAGYTTTFWSFAYADWDNNAQKSTEWAKKKILDSVHNGMVMLLHPNSETNTMILGEVILELKAQGYRFGTLDELEAYCNSKKNG